jgi:hypothetical protein
MKIEEIATLTKKAETKLIGALTGAYCLLKGSDMGNGIVGRGVVKEIADALEFFHSEKTKMENEKEWGSHSLNYPKDCGSLSNPEDFEY